MPEKERAGTVPGTMALVVATNRKDEKLKDMSSQETRKTRMKKRMKNWSANEGWGRIV
jgi:hypothetical protein